MHSKGLSAAAQLCIEDAGEGQEVFLHPVMQKMLNQHDES